MSPRMHEGSAAGADPLADSLRLYPNPLRQAVSASTWRATWYLLAYLVVSWLLFSAVLTAGLTAATLAITLAGLPLLIAAAAVIRGCAGAERRRLRSVLPRPVRGGYRDVRGLGLIARVRTTWTDPALWRDLAYLGGLFAALWTLDLAVDTLGKAIIAAAVFFVLSLLFQYVVVLTARMHARIAYSLLRAPVDPLTEAKEVLERPGPLGPLGAKRRNGNSGRSAPVT